MLMIRFRRVGKKNKPTYRLTVAEHTLPVNGSFVADVGFYNPHTKVAGLKKEDILAWLTKGAQPSNSVARLLEKEKVKHASVVFVKKNKKSKQTDKAEKPAAPAAPTAATESEETTAPMETVEQTEVDETGTEVPAEVVDGSTETEIAAKVSDEDTPAEENQ